MPPYLGAAEEKFVLHPYRIQVLDRIPPKTATTTHHHQSFVTASVTTATIFLPLTPPSPFLGFTRTPDDMLLLFEKTPQLIKAMEVKSREARASSQAYAIPLRRIDDNSELQVRLPPHISPHLCIFLT